ncbi:MAG: LacI family transcriptional regulator [Bacteroidetes bacterium CG12_big_fil_rev_8_21_14_0_65_60_17]|nr:MAG: LacI family transcriptional regulator [Bacteroidetes bacterium CG12_big_fil_rev_8_21_14_0_65_60_17]
MGVTIRDVARIAKVSISTVSRVLNDKCNVSEDKRVRVERAARDLGYIPNPAAQSLHSSRTGSLGVLLPFVSGEFYAEFLNGVDKTAQNGDWLLMISTSHNSEDELRAALKGMYRRVDGLLIMAPNITAESVLMQPHDDIPVVFVNTRCEDEAISLITFDNHGGMREMTRHLIATGHTRIGFIRGPVLAFDAAERERGYRDAHREAGLTVNEELIVPGKYSQQSGHDGAVRLLGMDPRPTAIMASNDDSAIGALSAIREAGLDVPSDVALTGFDDVPSARFTVPPLSTVHVPVRELGARSIEVLMECIKTGQISRLPHQTMDVELRIRKST